MSRQKTEFERQADHQHGPLGQRLLDHAAQLVGAFLDQTGQIGIGAAHRSLLKAGFFRRLMQPSQFRSVRLCGFRRTSCCCL
jgi:hypothetical protein